MPELSHALTRVWHLLFDLAEAQPDSWCLVGGLMVMLHGLEHGRSVRPTADGDVLVDIRARPAALREIIRFLSENGLEPELAPDGIAIASSAEPTTANCRWTSSRLITSVLERTSQRSRRAGQSRYQAARGHYRGLSGSRCKSGAGRA